MLLGHSAGGWGAVEVILPAAPGAGVELGWEWAHSQLSGAAALSCPLWSHTGSVFTAELVPPQEKR